MRLLEGAEDCPRHRLRHGRGRRRRILCQLQGRRPCRGGARAVRLLPLGRRDLLPRYGVETTLVDGTDLDHWEDAVRPNTKVFFLESPTNPTLEVIDIAAVAKIADRSAPRLVVDNVFATPILQKPLELGADIVVYSATKHIDGQGRCLGGVVLADEEWIDENLHDYFRHTGPAMSPFNAWVLLKGLETLPLRVHAADRSRRQASPISWRRARKSQRVIYPGRADHPQADIIAEADDGRLDAGLLRAEGRQGGGLRASRTR